MLFSNKDLKKLMIPLIFEQMLVMLVGMCDTVMVSSVGEAAVSGVSLVEMISSIGISNRRSSDFFPVYRTSG